MDEIRNAPAPRLQSVRAINQGTMYELSGRLRKLARDIDSGRVADVTDILIGVRCRRDHLEKAAPVKVFAYGPGSVEDFGYIAHQLIRSILG